MFSQAASLDEIQRQLTITASTLAEIKQAEKETEVTLNLLDLDSRISKHYESRLSKIEADIQLLASALEDLKNKLS